jgi:hypothetical protein
VSLRARLVAFVAALLWQACGGPDELSLCAGQDSSSSSLRIPALDEPGEPVVVTGRVLMGEQRRPVPDVRILVYHQNAEGRYARDDSGYLGAYLCGVLRTDDLGGYRIETIRPGKGEGSAHVHFDVSLPWGGRVFEALTFGDAPRWRDYPMGERWEEVRPVRHGPDGVQYVERDFWIRY